MRKIPNNLFFINFVPVIFINIIFLILWYIRTKIDPILVGAFVPLTEMFFNIILVPLYLIYFNYRYALRNKKNSFILNLFLMLVSILINNAFSYMNWGISSGLLLNPDYVTVAINYGVNLLNCTTILSAGILLHINFRYLKH